MEGTAVCVTCVEVGGSAEQTHCVKDVKGRQKNDGGAGRGSDERVELYSSRTFACWWNKILETRALHLSVYALARPLRLFLSSRSLSCKSEPALDLDAASASEDELEEEYVDSA